MCKFWMGYKQILCSIATRILHLQWMKMDEYMNEYQWIDREEQV